MSVDRWLAVLGLAVFWWLGWLRWQEGRVMDQLNFVRFVRWLCEHVDEPVGRANDVLESPVARFLRSVGGNDEEWWASEWVVDFVVALDEIMEGKQVEVTGGDCLRVLERLAE
jgi:hypothetical protein